MSIESPWTTNRSEEILRKTIALRRHHSRRWWIWLIVVLFIAYAAQLILSMLHNSAWDWKLIIEYFLAKSIVHAVWITWQLTFFSSLFGLILGIIVAVIRIQKIPFLSQLATGYIWIMRSIPAIVQLLFWFNVGYFFPTIKIGIPFGPVFLQEEVNGIFIGFWPAIFGFGLLSGAFFSEIMRASLNGIPRGQYLAAEALGIPAGWQFIRIILPQALRTMIPALIGQIIDLMKGTSLASVIAIPELFYTAQIIYGRNGRVVPLLAVVTLWYLLMTLLLSYLQYRIELYLSKHLGKSIGNQNITLPASFPTITPTTSAVASPLTSRSSLHLKPAGIAIGEITKSYGVKQILHNINLSIKPGEVITIIGPSGSGKSTLLRLISGLEIADSGLIIVDEEIIGFRQIRKLGQTQLKPVRPAKLRTQRKSIGFVFQDFHLFPHLTVLGNLIEAPLRRKYTHFNIVKNLITERKKYREHHQEIIARAQVLLREIGLAGFERLYPAQLSGGQQQRVAIARALVLEPSVLVMDEPTSALDPELVSEVLELIARLTAENVTILIVTHEINFAQNISDRIVFIDQGKIVGITTSEALFSDTHHARFTQFLSKVQR